MNHAVAIDQLTPEQQREAFYKMGRLDFLLKAHQVDDYKAFRRWNLERQRPGYQAYIEDIGALYDNMWIDECGRRYGKTAQWLIRDYEDAVRRPGCQGLIACSLKKSIGEIIVPLTKILFRDAPPGYFPEYYGTRGEQHEHLYIEATDSTIKLVGLDKDPDATRGNFLDFAHISEAAFARTLDYVIHSNIMHQFQDRPWAWIGLESSTARFPDHDFNRVFREDARARGCYRRKTIRDNTSLTDEDIRKEERRCGGKDTTTCKRELYCIEARDPDDMIIPEFDEDIHVVAPELYPRPKHALAHEGLDPGERDPFGLVFGYFDWERQTLVLQAGWHKSNASTGDVVGVIRPFELECWGSTAKLPGTPGRELSIAQANLTGGGKVWEAPDDALTYWDDSTKTLRANPYSRISDIRGALVRDLNTDYALSVRPAEKSPGSAEADLQYLRMLFAARHEDGRPKIVILKNGKTEGLIQQCRSGMWLTDDTGHRTEWARSRALGHCDELAALGYMVRDVRENRNPNPPVLVDFANQNVHIPESVREKQRPVSTVFNRGSAPADRTRGYHR